MPINTALFSNVPQARVDPAAFDTSNALNRAVQMSQFVNQNELARRKQAEADMLKNALANVDLSSPESMENLLRIPGGAQIATQLQQYQTGRQTADKQLVAERIKQYDTRLARIQTPGEAQEWVRDIANDPLLKSHMVATGFDPIRELREIPQDPAAIAKWRLDMLATPESVRTEAKPMPTQPESVRAYEFAKTPAGGGFKGTFEEWKRAGTAQLLTPEVFAQQVELAQARRAPPAPRAPVAVVGPDGKPTYVTSEQAIGMQPVTQAAKPLTAAQQQRLRKDMSADQASIKAAAAVADELEKLTDVLVGSKEKGIKPHPGLTGITGVQSYIPSFPSGAAKKAEQKLETFKGKIAAFGRQLASQEGKLGNMAVQEWKIVSDSVQKIDPAAGNLDEQMRDVVRQAQALTRRLTDSFDAAYEDVDIGKKGAPTDLTNLSDDDLLKQLTGGK